MAKADVLCAQMMGWGPGTVLISTEKGHPLSARSRTGAVGGSQSLFKITRIEGDAVYARLLYAVGPDASINFEESLTLTEGEWKVVPPETLEQLLTCTRSSAPTS